MCAYFFFLVLYCGKYIQHKIDHCNHFKVAQFGGFLYTHKVVQPIQLSNFRTFLSSSRRNPIPIKPSSERVSSSKQITVNIFLLRTR